jgi:hypothetical protein
LAGLTGVHEGFPRRQNAIVCREMLQLRVLLARMVFNRGDTLAIRALTLNFIQQGAVGAAKLVPSPHLTTSFCGIVYFSHCYRCGQPWECEECTFDQIRSEALEDVDKTSREKSFQLTMRRIGDRVCIDAEGNLLDPPSHNWNSCVCASELPDWGKTLRHDRRFRGMPMHYQVSSDAQTLHLLGRSFSTHHFGMGDFTYPERQPTVYRQHDKTNGAYLKDARVCDPPARYHPLAENARMNILGNFPPTKSRGAVAARDAGGLANTGAEPADVLHVEPPVWPLGSERVPDAFVNNPGGRVDIFYEPLQDPWDINGQRRDRRKAAMGPRPMPVVLRPAVDRTSELLERVEQRAAAHGIAPPYQQEGFQPASVEPASSVASSSGASSSAFGNHLDDSGLSFDLPPLQPVSDAPGDDVAHDEPGDVCDESDRGDDGDEYDGDGFDE